MKMLKKWLPWTALGIIVTAPALAHAAEIAEAVSCCCPLGCC